jgi:hypothetical protein
VAEERLLIQANWGPPGIQLCKLNTAPGLT